MSINEKLDQIASDLDNGNISDAVALLMKHDKISIALFMFWLQQQLPPTAWRTLGTAIEARYHISGR